MPSQPCTVFDLRKSTSLPINYLRYIIYGKNSVRFATHRVTSNLLQRRPQAWPDLPAGSSSFFSGAEDIPVISKVLTLCASCCGLSESGYERNLVGVVTKVFDWVPCKRLYCKMLRF